MIRRPWLAPLLLLVVSGMAWAQEERILSYHGDFAVRPDASMRVTDTIGDPRGWKRFGASVDGQVWPCCTGSFGAL